MEGQYPPPGYLPMSSQPHPPPQQYGAYASMPSQHNQHNPSSSGTEASSLPPIQHAGQSQYSHLPPLYAPSSHSNSPHPPHTPAAANGGPLPPPGSSGAMPPPSTTYMPAQSMYATSQTNNHGNIQPPGRLQDIRPIQPANYNTSPVTPFPSFNSNTALPGQIPAGYIPSQESEPTHVVGSQGRRGILPCIPGRAPAPASGASPAKSMIPQKDADGKYPCPHCNKTYLHAKHLKRHLLRHTGDRPYMCHLCKDTFSRSDILKRHFQKCSIRRGNPSGQNHLAGQRRNTGSSIKRLSTGTSDGLAESAGTPASYSNGSVPNTVNGSPTVNGDQSSYASSINSMSARSSRANSLIQPSSTYGDRHGLGLGLSAHAGEHHAGTSAGYASNIPAYARPHSISNPVHPSHYGYGPPAPHSLYQSIKSEDIPSNNYTASPGGMAQGRNPGQSNVDWSAMFPHNGQEAFMAHQQHAQDPSHVPKADHHVEGHGYNASEQYNDGFLNGMHQQTQPYGDETAHPQGMLVSR